MPFRWIDATDAELERLARFAAGVLKARTERGWSQRRLATELGGTHSDVFKLERHRHYLTTREPPESWPNVVLVMRVSELLEVTL